MRGPKMRTITTGLARRYGAHPLNLLALLASFSLAGYAVVLLVPSRPVAVVVWFVGAAIGHDLLLVPLYAIADGGLIRLWQRHRGPECMSPWINYIRVPTAISGTLLLVFLPSIARLSTGYHATTGLSSAGYLARWLAVTGSLFILSALAFSVRLRRTRNVQQRGAANAGRTIERSGPDAGGAAR